MFRLVPSSMISTTQAPISNVEEEKAEKKEERRKAKAKEHVLGKAQNATQRAAAKAEGLSEGEIKPWECKSRTDSGASNRFPIFTPDCRKMYSITTGQVVSTLSSSGSGTGSSSSDVGETACILRWTYQTMGLPRGCSVEYSRHRRIDNPCVFTSPRLTTSSYRQIMISESELNTSENESSKIYRFSLKAKKGTEKQAIKLLKEI
ncbi:hypothetical protein M422DRAFT_250035 [Sphaerobolus stellatus SS14]|nr:hypothetical protein M422DRAFT_250035 [Sphaerobolus stellatus SS14]